MYMDNNIYPLAMYCNEPLSMFMWKGRIIIIIIIIIIISSSIIIIIIIIVIYCVNKINHTWYQKMLEKH